MRATILSAASCLFLFVITFAVWPLAAGDRSEEELRKKFAEQILKADEARRQEELRGILAALEGAVEEARQRAAFSKLIQLRLPPGEVVPILERLLDHSDRNGVRYFAVIALGNFATTSRPAVPKIVAILNDRSNAPFVREAAALSLGQIGQATPEVVDALVSSLQASSVSEQLKLNVMDALGALGEPARKAAPLIQSFLKESSLEVQWKAYQALGKVKAAPLPALAQLRELKSIEWDQPDGAYATFKALEEAGAKGSFAVPLLLAVIDEDPPNYLYGALVRVLGEIGSNDPTAVKAILDAIAIKQVLLRHEATRALGKINPTNEKVVLVLANGLSDLDPYIQYQSALALRRAGADAKPAVPALAQAFKNVDSESGMDVLVSLLATAHSIGPAAAACADPIVALLPEQASVYKHRDKMEVHRLRAYMMVTLAAIGTPKKALPPILDALANSDVKMIQSYAAAARAAGALGAEGKETLPHLLRALDPKFADRGVYLEDFTTHHGANPGPNGAFTSGRIEAMRALARMGREARAAVPRLTQMVDEPQLQLPNFYPPYNEEARKALRAIQN